MCAAHPPYKCTRCIKNTRKKALLRRPLRVNKEVHEVLFVSVPPKRPKGEVNPAESAFSLSGGFPVSRRTLGATELSNLHKNKQKKRSLIWGNWKLPTKLALLPMLVFMVLKGRPHAIGVILSLFVFVDIGVLVHPCLYDAGSRDMFLRSFV